MIKIEKVFIWHARHKSVHHRMTNELPGFGCCGFRWCYYQLGRKWAWYRDNPHGNRNKMLKARFLAIIDKIKCEPPEGSKGMSLKFNNLINCKLKK